MVQPWIVLLFNNFLVPLDATIGIMGGVISLRKLKAFISLNNPTCKKFRRKIQNCKQLIIVLYYFKKYNRTSWNLVITCYIIGYPISINHVDQFFDISIFDSPPLFGKPLEIMWTFESTPFPKFGKISSYLIKTTRYTKFLKIRD